MSAEKYEDMIHLPHPVSSKHPQMSMIDRAAQFSPFSALTGYEDVIEESGRLTDASVELTESSNALLNEKLAVLSEYVRIHPVIRAVYFAPDRLKTGGSYITANGRVKRVDIYEQMLVLTDGRQIPFEAIYRLEGDLIDHLQ